MVAKTKVKAVVSKNRIAASTNGDAKDHVERIVIKPYRKMELAMKITGKTPFMQARLSFRRRFDELRDCLGCDPDDLGAIGDLAAWCDERRNAKPSNYEPIFDDDNIMAREF